MQCNGTVTYYFSEPCNDPTSAHPSYPLKQRRVVTIKGDGNCLFRALSHQLFNTEEHHLFIRTTLVRLETSNPHLFKDSINNSLSDHCASIIKPYVWGTHVELLAAATLFDKPVYYFDVKSQKWGVWRPATQSCRSKVQLKVPIISTWPAELSPISHLELEYHQNQHYNSIVNATTNLPCIEEPDIPTTHIYIHDTLS